ncbi:AAA-ATPase At3g50940-like [Arachis stenosperma]|uniref:AAA-ATPase At3g50940-like n=1 Tax=Arachis stenosperma TaxID=217475 RepID=UPI0025AC014D|nr:AAA-ATPase At3g50940-like [Arachis stenosperma]
MDNCFQDHGNNNNGTAVISTVASIAASAMLIRTIVYDYIPHEIINFFNLKFHGMKRFFSSQLTIVIEEFKGVSKNQVYEAAEVYLGSKGTLSAVRVKASKSMEDKNLAFVMDKNQEVCDDYEGVMVRWKLCCEYVASAGNKEHPDDINASLKSEVRSYELTFHMKHRDKIFNSYLPFVLERAKAIREGNMALKLHTIDYDHYWVGEVKFCHPMSFKTLAIDDELKKEIVDDLEKFVNGKEFYKRIGKAWKRGYLLYGPPGTGKSSLIAAMANYLNYDIYDLDLTAVSNNKDLKNLILGMSNRSILVMEDIDCTIKLPNREEEKEDNNNNKEADKSEDSKVTLSGLLNAIDGLWSCCGEERIIVLTTNHKEKLDPALIRAGRMDIHIHLSYCTFSAFQQLAFNYLGISQHKLFEEIQGLLGKVQVTPAEISGELTKNINSKEPLQELVRFLHSKDMVQEPQEISELNKVLKGVTGTSCLC